jgi:hypothetical protein
MVDRQRRRRIQQVAAPIALLLAAFVLTRGPYATVVCGEGHPLDTTFQSVRNGLGFGHIDGVAASYCMVPTTLTWALVGLLVITSVALAVVAASRRPARD